MNVYAKFRNFPLRINKVLGIFENGNNNPNNGFGPFRISALKIWQPYPVCNTERNIEV